jgi:hypothetical protein
MWPFNKKHNEDEKACLNIISDFLAILPASGDYDDNEIEDILISKGHDKRLSRYVVVMLPVIAGREIVDQLGIKEYQNSFFLVNHGKVSKKVIQFHDFPACIAIMQSRQQILAHPNIQNIMLHSEEIILINKGLDQGMKYKEMRIAPVFVVMSL